MKKVVFLYFCLISNCYAQDLLLKSSSIQTSLLKAITIQNEVLSTNYYYGATLLDTPYALQIPFRERNDVEVLKGYKEYKNLNRYASNVFSIAIVNILLMVVQKI
jgi:hypothetical protein